LIRAVVDADAALRSTLDSQSPVPISYYTEYLDLNLFDGAMPLPGLREWLQRKYEARHLDLIVAGGSRALRIALQNRAALFSNAPVVFVSVDAAAAADLRLAADVTGTWLHIPWAETLETARQLQPEIRRVVVVTGSSPTDRVWTAAARQQLAPTAESIEVTYLSGHGIDEVLATVKSLTPSTVVLLGPFLRDATGRDFLAKDAARLIAAASSVPVYALFDTAVGTGVVGGHVVSFEAHGKTAGALALRVLAGQHPPPTDVGVTVPMFDTRQLTRWGLDARRLPAGSLVQFQEMSLWGLYHWYILGGIGMLLVQSVLIGTLLVQRARGRRTQATLANSEKHTRDLAGRLMVAQEEERRRIARDLHDDVNQELVAQMLALSTLRDRLADVTTPGVREEVAGLRSRVMTVSRAIRQLSHSLHPGVLEHVGLVTALRGYCGDFERTHGLPVSFHGDGELGPVLPDVALCLYRVTQEGLGNVARHAGARHARVTLERDGDDVVLTLGDDGRGFDPSEARSRRGLGLLSLDERARLVGGRLTIKRESEHGTVLQVTLPLSKVLDVSRNGTTR
jgi:signal transduction histidine kinase